MNKIKYALLAALVLPNTILADGNTIDKIYHPYVQALEHEVEWRMISADGDQKHRFGLGKSLSDRLFIEGYLIAKDENNHFKLEAFEIEAKWQLTEQGEYAADWAVIVELEKELDNEQWEFATGLIAEKEWGRWIGTANLWAIYEWGDHIKNELESALALQVRYRYSRSFEPAVELYAGEDTLGLGPTMLGDIRIGKGKKLHWEMGVIWGLDSETANTTWRLLTEFEF
ncbi:MAG: hypothetical protein HRT92_03705 [Piscirickettsiaceae bacterium]|nr:hypothetical protein [Piscirickettsiaceae bacterium]